MIRERVRREAEEDDSYWSRKHPPRNNGFEYWKTYSRSGAKRFAKRHTNRVIRRMYRDKFANKDPEDVVAETNSDYQKEFDYWWCIY